MDAHEQSAAERLWLKQDGKSPALDDGGPDPVLIWGRRYVSECPSYSVSLANISNPRAPTLEGRNLLH